jgi:hypothetical protein
MFPLKNGCPTAHLSLSPLFFSLPSSSRFDDPRGYYVESAIRGPGARVPSAAIA